MTAKKRYLIGHDLPETEQTWHGTTLVTAVAEGGMEFWIPKGANRFHFTGGARFIHGGAMLQEIVVPVITVRHKKDKAVRGDTKTTPVTVHVLGTQPQDHRAAPSLRTPPDGAGQRAGQTHHAEGGACMRATTPSPTSRR